VSDKISPCESAARSRTGTSQQVQRTPSLMSRRQVVELEGAGAARTIERRAGAGNGGAEVEIAIGQFDGEVLVDLVGETAIGRPGEIPLIGASGEYDAALTEPTPGLGIAPKSCSPLTLLKAPRGLRPRTG